MLTILRLKFSSYGRFNYDKQTKDRTKVGGTFNSTIGLSTVSTVFVYFSVFIKTCDDQNDISTAFGHMGHFIVINKQRARQKWVGLPNIGRGPVPMVFCIFLRAS